MSALRWVGEKILTSLLQELGRKTGEARAAAAVRRKLQPKPAEKKP